MKPSVTPFTVAYTQWLDCLRAMLPGGRSAAPARELTPQAAQVVADQEWEDEGGSIKQAKKPGLAPGPKIPL